MGIPKAKAHRSSFVREGSASRTKGTGGNRESEVKHLSNSMVQSTEKPLVVASERGDERKVGVDSEGV